MVGRRRQKSRLATVALLTLTVWITECSASFALAPWHVYLDGADITVPASPMDRGGALMVNIVSLAPVLGFGARVEGDELTLTDPTGRKWRATNGSTSLDGDAGSISLSYPIMIHGTLIYIPIDAIAEVTNLRVDVNREGREANLSELRSSVISEAEGWEAFTVEKAPEDRAPRQETSVKTRPDLNLPPMHDKIKLGLGLGYVQGTDWGAEILASGKFRGNDVNIGSLLTMGPRGLRSTGGRISMTDWEKGRGFEGGDLFSDLWGLARGARYSWHRGDDRWSSLSAYLKSSRTGNRRSVLVYRDEVKLRQDLALGGELATDGSLLLKGRYQADRFSVYGYQRSISGPSDADSGAFASYDLGKGMNIYGGISRSGDGMGRRDWKSLSLRMPVRSGMDLILEHSTTEGGLSRNSANAAMFTVPIGPLRLLTRYQDRRLSHLQPGMQSKWFSTDSKELMASAVYFADPKLSFDLQVSTRWMGDSTDSRWEQLVSTYRISRKTQLQTISAFPGVFDSSRFRLRLNHDLKDDLSLIADYGRLTPYQSTNAPSDSRGLKIMLRKRWDIKTPSRGGEVRGCVTDQLGRPFAKAVIQVNGYRTQTDDKGRYVLRNISPGTYDVFVDDASLPADYKSDGEKRRLEVSLRSKEEVNFRVVPLNTISGRVYTDLNENDKYDPGEGRVGVVLHLSGFATATDQDGTFGFYNLEPGMHTVTLDAARLPSGFVPAGPSQAAVNLSPDVPITGLEFVIIKREKAVIFQELR